MESKMSISPSSSLTTAGEKEYQTLFWVPMIFQTAKKVEAQVQEMLDLIQEFHEVEDKKKQVHRNSILQLRGGQQRRRQQILGDMLDSEVVTTRVDVVLKSDNTKYCIMSVLKSHFLFSQLHDYELEDVIDSMQNSTASEGENIITEGEAGDVFYILEEGICEISVKGEVLGQLKNASAFGDLALMYNSPRAATVKAVTDCMMWTLDRVFFRQAMVTSSSNQNVQLSQFLSKIPLFQSLTVQSLNQLARSLTKQSYDDGQYIIRQGEIGEQFYIIYKGLVRVTIMGDNGEETELTKLSEGKVFGDRALIRKEPRAANVISEGSTECYFLNSHDFSSMLGEIVDKLKEYNEFLVVKGAHIFHSFGEQSIKVIKKSLQMQTLFSGQRILCDQENIYIVMEGQMESSTGLRYGSSSCIGDLNRGADTIANSLTAITYEAKLALISRKALLDFMEAEASGRLSGLEQQEAGASSESSSGEEKEETKTVEVLLEMARQKRINTAALRRQSVAHLQCTSLSQLKFIKPLGRGTFGCVYLAKQKVGGRLIGLKCLDKKALMESSQYDYVKREIIALQSFKHPFLGAYYGVILTPRKVIFLIEYVPGGELWNYLYGETDTGIPLATKGPYGGISVYATVLYAATIILALEHIHDQGYSYRDLKPENLLIASNGYLKLVDFGFAKAVPFINKSKQIQYRTFTLCGTPDYMAPEVVLTQGHDKSADYWAFGILIYELLCGHTPFEGRNQQRTFEKIVHSQKHLTFPSAFESHCKSFIRRLLHPNPALRLGALQNGFKDIHSHAFFTTHNLNFESIVNEELPMPYVPNESSLSSSSAVDGAVDIDTIDFDNEEHATVEDDYSEYFDSLNNLDVNDE